MIRLAERWGAPASLGAKLVLILTGVGLIGAAALALLLATVIMPGFNQLERDAADAQVARTHAVVHDLAAGVETIARDHGDRNAAYDPLARPDRAIEQTRLPTLATDRLDIDGMAYLRPDGSVAIARWFDPDRRADAPAIRAAFTAAIRRLDLARVLHGRSAAGFYLRLRDTLAVIGVARVRGSDGSGTARGYLLVARTVTARQLGTMLGRETALAPPQDAVGVVPDGGHTRIAVPLPGPDGRAVASVGYSVPRNLSMLGRRMLLFAVVGSSVLLGVVLLLLRRMIARLVLKPLHRVERDMGVVRASGTFGLLTEAPRADEIGSLVTSFNSMLRQLKDLREQVEVQSFTLGRSESAVAVMHNVRNALNPISTVLSQGLGQSAAVDRATMERALGELARGDVPAVRRQKLSAYLAASLEAIEQERADRAEQLAVGREALRHVLEIIGEQQQIAHERPPLEPCDVTAIVAMNATIARHTGQTSIAFSFPSRPCWVRANRVILSQVVGNLFANAAEAIAATGRGSGSIAVHIHSGEGQVEIAIRDDGEGFDPEDAPMLFQRGFSTRAHKSGGLGLHWCANCMLAMEGTLELLSEGTGRGARALLTLGAAPIELPGELAG